jgi:hypothetical protein
MQNNENSHTLLVETQVLGKGQLFVVGGGGVGSTGV